jgi:regulator of RNase E activity RraA
VAKSQQSPTSPSDAILGKPDIPKDKHWTDCPAAGTVVILQQPPDQSVALLGDIVATRFKVRGVRGAVIDGRARDVVSCGELCKDGGFQVWSKALSSVGTSMEAKPWAVDVPLTIGGLVVKPGDIICADEGEGVTVVIPKEKLEEVSKLLPKLKQADDGLLKDVQDGMDFRAALERHPDHYSNH